MPTLLGAYFFVASLNNALDSELTTLESSLGHAITVENGRPHFRDWTRIVQTDPSRSLATIQLFDANGNLLERYGAAGINILLKHQKEANLDGHSMRLVVTPLELHGATVGYMQVEVPTKGRDAAVRQFALAMAVMAPAVLLGLGLCSYYVSQKATVSIRQTIDMLRQFMADAGHELNTPLSVINASSEALQHKLQKQGASFNEIDVIARSADRMQRIIDDLALLAEIEAPAQSGVTLVATNLHDVIEQGLTEFSYKFEQKGIKLENSEIPQCVVMGAEESLRMMFSNLLENALRYTDEGGVVRVEAQRDASQVQIKVSDTGIGIPDDSLPHIFERFYRVDKSRSRSSGGSGLGLAIVRAIVQAHLGDIRVESKQGSGSQFTVTLPISG
jgi:signal transduction histidine kinase